MAKRKNTHKIVSKKHIARQERERRQSNIVRNIALGVVLAVILLIGYGMFDQAVLKERRPVASVNGEEITLGQFEARVRLERDGLINQYAQYTQLTQSFGMDFKTQLSQIETQLSDYQGVGQNVLKTMTYELLYRQIANEEGITFSADEIEANIQEYLGYYADGTPTPEPTTEVATAEAATLSPAQLELVTVTPEPTTAPTLTPAPTATPDENASPTAVPVPTMTATEYTYEGYQSAYAETLPLYEKYGLKEADFRFLFEANLYYTALYDKVTADVENTGQEYIWVRHILVDDPVVAKVIREKVLAGEDFSKLAAESSIDPSAATNYGDLGWFTHGAMVPAFEDAAFALENVGDVSEVVQTDSGYHIIQLLGRETRPMDDAAYQNLKDSVFQQWITAKYDENDIQTFDIWQSSVPTTPDLQQALAEKYGQ